MEDAEHDDELQRQLLAQRLQSYQPRRAQRYEAVHVLLLSWADDDIGPHLARELRELHRMFREVFGYAVSHYQIPSKDPGTSLNCRIAQLIDACGGDEDLIIVYYSGHGGPQVTTKSPCTWAAKISEGPALDWACIQPTLFLAACDCVLFLDCCYAGQAARSQSSRNIELLAATDKDNWTPIGKTDERPSFTRVLIREMEEMLSAEGLVTLPNLQRRMVAHESGLMRQPFYVPMKGDSSAGPIRLTKMGALATIPAAPAPAASSGLFYLRVTLFDLLDPSTAAKIIRWLTKDSPTSIADVEFVSQVVSDAKGVNELSKSLLNEPQDQNTDAPFLSRQARAEARRLFDEVQLSLSGTEDSGLGGLDIIQNLKNACANFLNFGSDTLETMDHGHLTTLSQVENDALKELKRKISLRLTLIDENLPLDNDSRTTFDNETSQTQRLRMGKKEDRPVLVEYIYYDTTNQEASKDMALQVKRICALQADTKSSAFRCLQSLGVSHETLYGPRYGLIYGLPEKLRGREYSILSDLIVKARSVPLEVRVRLASSICEAILHLHSVGWYHKNIRSANVLIFASDETQLDSSWDFSDPYLIGFDCSRPEDAESRYTIDFSIKDNIYRHPDRWGVPQKFEKHHDFYSLGILLMEIGSWRNLPDMDGSKRGFEHVRKPESLRELLLTALTTKLAHASGTKYAEAVKFCLDRKDWMAGEEWHSQKIMRENVLRPLTECHMGD